VGRLQSLQQVLRTSEIAFDAPLLEQSDLPRESQRSHIGRARFQPVTDSARGWEGGGLKSGAQLRQRFRGSRSEELDETGVKIDGPYAADLGHDFSIDLA